MTSKVSKAIITAQILQFYTNGSKGEANFKRFTDYLEKYSVTALSTFVESYASAHGILIEVRDVSGCKRMIDVCRKREALISSIGKPYLDVCCRVHAGLGKIKLNGISTTYGQLNYFKWAMEDQFLDYVIEHYDEITAYMNKLKREHSTKKKRVKKASVTRKAEVKPIPMEKVMSLRALFDV